MAAPGDALWWPEASPPNWIENLAAFGLPRLIPVADPRPLQETHRPLFWATDPWAADWCHHWGFPWENCEPHRVIEANSRRFQTQLEVETGLSPGGLSLATSLTSLREAIAALPSETTGWILKSEFGTAGRESRRGQGSLSPEIAAWATRQFARGLAIILEPRLDRLSEASVHFEIIPSGDIEYIGTIGCEATANGTYVASRLLPEVELPYWNDAVESGWQVARRLREIGYWGPVGIDAMRYRAACGEEKIRPIQDINARHTMGRLALNLSRFPILSNALGGRISPATWVRDLLHK